MRKREKKVIEGGAIKNEKLQRWKEIIKRTSDQEKKMFD